MEKLVSYLRDNKKIVLGVVLGAAGGFLYWKYVGCASGTCPLSSNPIISTVYWGFMGGMGVSLLKKDTKTTVQNEK